MPLNFFEIIWDLKPLFFTGKLIDTSFWLKKWMFKNSTNKDKWFLYWTPGGLLNKTWAIYLLQETRGKYNLHFCHKKKFPSKNWKIRHKIKGGRDGQEKQLRKFNLNPNIIYFIKRSIKKKNILRCFQGFSLNEREQFEILKKWKNIKNKEKERF